MTPRSDLSAWLSLGVFAGILLASAHATPPEPERWFMPGPLGHEPATGAAAAPAPAPGGLTAFTTRAFSGLGRPEEIAWGQHNGLTAPLECMHHLAAVFPTDLYSAHPEYFPLVDGKRFSPRQGSSAWNPDLGREDVARHAAEVAKAWFAQHPQADAYSLGINDSFVFGESPETLALVTPPTSFRGRPDYSRLVFTFMNRAAADVAAAYPDKYLGCLAYYWAEDAPPFAVDPHVIPVVTSDRTQAYDPAFQREEFDLQTRWAAALGVGRPPAPGRPAPRLGIYDYLYGSGFLIPRLPFHALAEQIRHARQVGFTDYYAEVYPNWGLDGPLPWVVAQLIQSPGADVDALLDEYCRRYFQDAAAPMRAFYARCEQQWMQQKGAPYWLKYYRNDAQTLVFPSAVCAELRHWLEEARVKAEGPTVRDRVAFAADSFGVTERLVALQEARAELANRVLRRPAHGGTDLAALRRYLDNRADFLAYARSTATRYPLAFASINYDDFLRNHPAFPAALTFATEGLRSDLSGREEPEIKDALEMAVALREHRVREVAVNGGLEGALKGGRRIAGLVHAMELPAPWLNLVEPTAAYRGAIAPSARHGGAQGLRISGAENTTMFQWLPVTGDRLYLASTFVRGEVAPGDTVTLTLGWLDKQQRPVGSVAVIRLPDGSWPEWVQLRQGARAPASAAWAGLGIRIQHQVPGDWAELDDLSLLEVQPPPPASATAK